ncbi:hypothetical protein ACFL08_03260 [Patescibacteria group bacterium]
MKLKFLFFPASLVAATVLVIWFIWPTWFNEKDGIGTIMEEIKVKEAELLSVQTKKSNLTSLNASMNSDGEVNKKFTMRYYPETEKNEIIVNEINQFAKSSNVIITQTGVETTKAIKSRAKKIMGQCLLVSPMESSTARVRTEGAPIISIKEGEVDVVRVSLTVVGDYADVKKFLSSVYGMEMVNNISAINIKRTEGADIAEGGATSGIDKLEAEVSACFGYLPQSTVSLEGDFLEHLIFAKSSFNFDYITNLREMISKTASDIAIGSTSKSNPFVQ